MNSTFASRITVNFATLFLAAMGIMFSLWYLGLPQIGLVGADSQRLMEATRSMEQTADHHRASIALDFAERCGDVLMLAEDTLVTQHLGGADALLQPHFAQLTERMMRAYPKRYQSIFIVDPTTLRIRAGSAGVAVGTQFTNTELMARASMPGVGELVGQIATPQNTSLAIVRQMRRGDGSAATVQSAGGILVAVLNVNVFIRDGEHERTAAGLGTTLLIDNAGQLLPTTLRQEKTPIAFTLNPRVAPGFEGVREETDPMGRKYFVVYRQVPLSGTQTWTLVHYMARDEAFVDLITSANKLFIVGVLLTLAALALIGLAARRLTKPLQSLAETARQLERGDLSARALAPSNAGREIASLSEAFNAMAQSIEKDHRTLESRVDERTDALLRSQKRHRTFFESTADAVLLTDQSVIIDCNAAAITLFGATERNDLLGHLPSEFSPPRQFNGEISRITAIAHLKQALMHGKARFEWIHRRIDSGETFFADVLLNQVDIDGRLFMQATVRDISGRKRAEAEQRIAEIAFESQEGMYVSDAQWAILRVNRAFSRITGYSAEEAVGQLPGDLLGSGQQDANFYAAMTSSLVQHGSWQGEVIDKRKNGDIFPAWMILTAVKSGDGTLTHYVASITDFTERKAAELEIKNLAFFDPLTNLPNRRLLLDRLDQTLTACARHARNGALLFIDLDNFKSLNDTRGHDIGDLLLQQVAHRLVACVREGDTVARLGGDEFVVMLPDLSENAQEAAFQAETVGEKILAALNQDYELAGQGHTSTPSIGVTLFADQQQTMEELLKRADLAMYQAKAAGRNTLRFFDPAMQTAVTARATMEAGLREAVLKQQFLLHYQAQVRGSGDVMGAEVLVRWLHPERGMVSPAEFIPLAEETGVIFALGSWVLETACQQLVQWAARPEMAHLSVSVNVSVRQFNHRDFVAQVLSVLERTGANPQRLKLELTESLLASNVDDIVAKMIALKARGVSFSLDDFGTGYSSLSYLKRLPLDQLKIDQSFVRDILVDPNDAAIAKMVIALADSLGLAVVAEGVETEAQCAYLASQGCNAYQGYYFSRPLPVKEFERFATQAIT